MDEARIKILGVPFDPLGMEEAVERIASFMAVDQCHLVVTANPETVMKAGEDRELMAILQEAQLVVADGIGIVWA
ncbi:MAG: glycosyltransferase, partial [bacterium]